MFFRSFDAALRHCLALILVCGAVDAWAGNILEFDQALQLARERSRQLVAQGAAVTAAREMAMAAGQLPDPTLKAGINNLPVNGADQFSLTRDFMTMRSLGLAQEFVRDDKRRARAARFEREAEAAQANGALALANLQRDTAIAWLDRYFLERLRDVLLVQRDEAKLQIAAAEAAYRGGKGTQADLLTARAFAAQIDDKIAQAERQVATAKIQLVRWVGDSGAQPLASPPATGATPVVLAELEHRLAHHPQIASMVKQEEMAEADVQLARANKKADWSAELMFSQRGSAYSNMVSLNISLPLQWDQKNRQDRELAAKLATAEQMRAQREEAAREHLAEARAMLEEWQSNRERLARYETTLLPLAVDRTRAALAAYRGGGSPLVAVLEARRNEIEMRMERLRLDMETARLWAQLNYLIPAGHVLAASRP